MVVASVVRTGVVSASADCGVPAGMAVFVGKGIWVDAGVTLPLPDVEDPDVGIVPLNSRLVKGMGSPRVFPSSLTLIVMEPVP
ncbi:MAG TPA: hypothetical protein PKV78_13175 [Methanoculleus thermophilus]|nr:hypothetical protein [Methanoculleus thermophilus]